MGDHVGILGVVLFAFYTSNNRPEVLVGISIAWCTRGVSFSCPFYILHTMCRKKGRSTGGQEESGVAKRCPPKGTGSE